jgi:hypothetical protein
MVTPDQTPAPPTSGASPNKKARDKMTAQTILNQMGGTNRLTAMIGARNFCTVANGVKFNFKGSRKANVCIITLSPNDTYTMQLGKINLRTCAYEIATEESELYFNEMVGMFEEKTGLRLSL